MGFELRATDRVVKWERFLFMGFEDLEKYGITPGVSSKRRNYSYVFWSHTSRKF